jgi:hypothetical protein
MALPVVCVERAGKGEHRHVAKVGVATGNSIIRFSVKVVRRLIKQGDVAFYVMDAEGRMHRLRRYRCPCGRGSLWAGDHHAGDGLLAELPSCGR